MQRLILGLAAVAALAACTDSTPTGTRARGPDLRAPRSAISIADAQEDLDAEIRAIIACWPTKQEDDLTKRWEGILKKYNEGQTEPKKLNDAIKKLAETSKEVLKQTPKMVAPCEGMSAEEAAAKLVMDMVLYVYGGDPDGENASGILKPDEELTLVTSQGGAGVHFDEGSTNEDRIIVISEFLTEYSECDGPLLTELCQYPLYFDIQSFPDGALLKVAQAAVCHLPVGASWPNPTGEIHGRLRLAHEKPDNPADYTPGSSIRDTPASQENIEILPYITQDPVFLLCDDVEWPPDVEDEQVGVLQRGVRLASAFASRVVKLLTPKSAYAIDQGGGGEFLDFGSPFNNVDPCSGPTPEASCEAPTGFTGFTGFAEDGD